MKMSLLGPVGSGKRTQSQRISERLDRRAGPGSDKGRYRADMRSRVTSTGRAGPGRRDHGSGAAHLQPAGTWLLDDFDSEEALRRQFEAYRKETEAIKEHYNKKGVLSVMDADRGPSKVAEDILQGLSHPEKSP